MNGMMMNFMMNYRMNFMMNRMNGMNFMMVQRRYVGPGVWVTWRLTQADECLCCAEVNILPRIQEENRRFE